MARARSMAEIFAITVKQPMANAIVWMGKRVENRPKPYPWHSAVGTRICIHAGASYSNDYMEWAIRASGGLAAIHTLIPKVHSAIIGVATLTDVHEADDCCGPWAAPTGWHLVLDEVRSIRNADGQQIGLPCKGRLGLWRVPEDIAAGVLSPVGPR